MLDQQLTRSFRLLCRSVGSEVSAQALKLFESGDFLGLVSMRLNPLDYTSPRVYFEDASVVNFFKKCRLDIPGVNRKGAAHTLFEECEHTCKKTNIRFARFIGNHSMSVDEAVVLGNLERAKSWLAEVLGRIPLTLDGRFGPGATFGDRGKLTTIADKISSRATVTKDAKLITDILFKDNAWTRARCQRVRDSEPEVIRGNRFTTVPKDALKDRGICIEPSLNIFSQLSLGKVLRRKLLQRGIDLTFGQDYHRSLACQASRDGSLATIDLSNASDTVSVKLVEWLFPREWYELLASLRSPFTLIGGKWVRLEKFSSMGNGYTFELESLIFSALLVACGLKPRGDFHVYGDDMIIPTEAYGTVVQTLNFCGFSVNESKSFHTGKFRESCGGDFFDGVSVRTHYLKDLPNEPQHWISLVNGIRRMGSQNPDADFRYSLYYNVWLRCLEAIPTNIRRLRGPEQLGDLCITDDKYDRRWRNGIGWIRVYRPISKPLPWHHWWPEVVLATALYGGGETRGLTPRSSVSGYKIGYAAFS